MTINEKLKYIEDTLNDYYAELWNDPEIQQNLLYLIGRFLMTGEDITDAEVDLLYDFLNKKINNLVKTKAN